MAVEKIFTCNLCGCRLGELNGLDDAVPGWGLRSYSTRPGWYKVGLDSATIHVCAVCGPAISEAFELPMHLVNALERAKTWARLLHERTPNEMDKLEAVRLLRDVAEASK